MSRGAARQLGYLNHGTWETGNERFWQTLKRCVRRPLPLRHARLACDSSAFARALSGGPRDQIAHQAEGRRIERPCALTVQAQRAAESEQVGRERQEARDIGSSERASKSGHESSRGTPP
jgi:hypothetical protein